MLYSWTAETQLIQQIKQITVDKFQWNINYGAAGMDTVELRCHLSCRTYSLNFVDALLDILSNATSVTHSVRRRPEI